MLPQDDVVMYFDNLFNQPNLIAQMPTHEKW